MKIAVGTIWQESNTFSGINSTINDFVMLQGESILKKYAIERVFIENEMEINPTLWARALPGGPVCRTDFNYMKHMLVEALHADVDGVWLYLHGAMYVEGIGSGEEALLIDIRKKIGYNKPIAVALDLHANNTEKFISMTNIVCGYRTAPHIDSEETQVAAAKLLINAIKQKTLPRSTLIRVPMMLPGEKFITSMQPAAGLITQLDEAEKHEGILKASIFAGMSWVDAPYSSASIVISANTKCNNAYETGLNIARKIWEKRYQFHISALNGPLETAVIEAGSEHSGIFFISDSGDNITGGAAGDNAHSLRRLLEIGVQGYLVIGIHDAVMVQQCINKGVGKHIYSEVGGRYSKISERCSISGEIISLRQITDDNWRS